MQRNRHIQTAPLGTGTSPVRLFARPGAQTKRANVGLSPLGIERGRDGYVYVPEQVKPGALTPLVVALHGAGSSGESGIRLLRRLADATGTIVLAPDSRGTSWDILRGGFGPDIDFIDTALTQVFSQHTIDPMRLAIGGFSDGASYALSVGIMNGDLFSHILAFSPGFASPAIRRGAPLIFISHGTQDTVLPIERCSRQIVPLLIDAGYDVVYREFDGPHAVPPELADDALSWFLGKPKTTTRPILEQDTRANHR